MSAARRLRMGQSAVNAAKAVGMLYAHDTSVLSMSHVTRPHHFHSCAGFFLSSFIFTQLDSHIQLSRFCFCAPRTCSCPLPSLYTYFILLYCIFILSYFILVLFFVSSRARLCRCRHRRVHRGRGRGRCECDARAGAAEFR